MKDNANTLDHFAILKWVAGSEKPLPSHLEFDENRLIELVDLHNLSGRFLRRIKDQVLPWITSRLTEALQELYFKTSLKVVEHTNAIGQINSQLRGNSPSSIVVKGISTYALVNLEYTKRYGCDIDLLYSDPTLLVDVLEGLGYRQSKTPFQYEVGGYQKGDVEIDVHEYFPVFSYPDALMSANLNPLSHPGIWCQNYQMDEHRITYDDLKEHSCCGRTHETRNLCFPDPNMLTLIFCAHAFRHYTDLWSISHRGMPGVPLAELGDLFELVEHPAFNSTQFLILVNRFGGRDSVEWAACLCSSFFGRNPLPIPTLVHLDDELPAERFPRCLWWNFWADLSSPVDELLDCDILPMSAVIRQLGANEVASTERYSTTNTGTTGRLPRLIIQVPDETPIPLELEVSESERGVRVDLNVLSVPQGDIDRVRVDFGHIASEWIHSTSGHQQSLVGASAITFFIERGAGYGLTIEFAWGIVGFPARTTCELPMLIGVAKQSSRDGLVASMLIPLNVSFGR
jgi:hypothetical protein